MRDRIIIFTILVFFSLLFPIAITDAANEPTYEVSPGILHVRDEPAKSGNIIGVLQKGDRVKVFEEKHGWAQTYYAGEIAWIAKHHLFPINGETQITEKNSQRAEARTITITNSNVIIRSGPGQEHDAIASTSKGASYTVIDKNGDWLSIQLSNGNTGWVAAWLTSDQNATSVSNENTPESLQTASQTTTNETSLAGRVIVIDAGHGGRDPGATGLDGIQEKNLVTPTASTIANTLRAYGATVIETRTGDYYLTLDQRAQISNNYYTDAFLSIHYDSFPVLSVQGVGAYYTSDAGHVLAQFVQKSLASALPLENRGVRKEDYRVLQHTNAPAILLELGFITNPYDLSIINNSNYRTQVAEAIAIGLVNYFNR